MAILSLAHSQCFLARATSIISLHLFLQSPFHIILQKEIPRGKFTFVFGYFEGTSHFSFLLGVCLTSALVCCYCLSWRRRVWAIYCAWSVFFPASECYSWTKLRAFTLTCNKSNVNLISFFSYVIYFHSQAASCHSSGTSKSQCSHSLSSGSVFHSADDSSNATKCHF